MVKISTVGIICKPSAPVIKEAIQQLVSILEQASLDVLFDESARRYYGSVSTTARETLCEQSDLVIVIGGDGTLLSAARAASETDTPILGINLGRLGFLTDFSPDDIEREINNVLNGEYTMGKRMLLTGKVIRGDKVVFEKQAFNDVVYHMHNAVRMVEFETRVDERFVSLQRADGVIVSTPNGSTAYALSAGGPILEPSLEAIVLAPVCPHTLNSRPIVVHSSRNIRIIPKARTGVVGQVSFDAQETFTLRADDEIVIEKSKNAVTLIHPENHDFFHVLREKLNWAEQPINDA